IDELLRAELPARTGILAWSHRRPEWPFMQEILSPSGNAEEAARTLFASLRRLDEAGLDLILAEPAPEEGLGRAINDRLRRAAAERAQRNL
ncbi:MAG: L-threonylcarbamoyladenylate synthase type 1 TsaC, partial [Bacteroidetes bacterium]